MRFARYAFYGSGLALCLSLSGCFGVPSEATKTIVALRSMAQSGAGSTAPQRTANLPKISVVLAKLTPFPGGKGLIVCEPVAKSDSSTADFGAGCTRWLHLAVSGQGQLSQTPLWDTIGLMQVEMKKPNLRLTTNEAFILAQKAAVSHIATATITGSPKQATLTLRLWKMPEKKAVGSPLSVNGTHDEIWAALPGLGSKLSAAVGVTKPQLIPLTPSAADTAFMGRLSWSGQTQLQSKDVGPLMILSGSDPLAAMLVIGTENSKSRFRDNGTIINYDFPGRTLARVASYNTIALSEAAWHSVTTLRSQQADLDKAVQSYPQNYLIAVAETCWHRGNAYQPGRPVEMAAIQRAVRCATRNPEAWVGLAFAVSNLASDVRKGRYYYKMSAAEQSYVGDLYDIEYQCTQRAIALDPQYYRGWYKNAMSATFSGHMSDAYASLKRASAIYPGETGPYDWALQIYQPKWGGKTSDLLALVKKIEGDPLLMEKLHGDVHYALLASELKDEMARFDKVYSDFMEAEIAKNPLDARPKLVFAEALFNQGDYAKSQKIYLDVLKTVPNSVETNFHLGWIEHNINRHYVKAEKYYRATLALSPNHAGVLFGLAGITHYVHHDAVGAEALYRKAISIRNYGLYHADLARLLLDTGRKAEAQAEADQAVSLGYTDSINEIWNRLGMNP